jgi:hypothetical protein
MRNIHRWKCSDHPWATKGARVIPERRKLLGQSPNEESCSGNPRVTKGTRAIPEWRKLLGQSPSGERYSGNPRAEKAARAIPEWRKVLGQSSSDENCSGDPRVTKALRRIMGFSFETDTNGGRQLLWPAKLVTNNKGMKPRMEKLMLSCHFPKFRTLLQARVAPFIGSRTDFFTFREYPSCEKNYPRRYYV